MKKELGIFVLLVVLCIYVSLKNPQFASIINLQNTLRLVGLFGIFSIGMGLVIITGGIDLSVGSLFALQGVVLGILLTEMNWPWPLAVLVILVGSMLLGAIHGFMVAKVRMQPFIVTLCALLIYRGLARTVADEGTKGFGAESYGPLRTLVSDDLLGIPIPFVILAVVAIVFWVILHRSVYGRYLLAVGRNEDASRYSGINSQLVIGSAYVVSMFLAGISGILFAFYTNSVSPSTHGNIYELYGIAAAVLGGCSLRGGEGSIFGIVIGAALLQVLHKAVIMLGYKSSYEYIVMGSVIFIGVLADQLLAMHRSKKRAVVVETVAKGVDETK